jgi:NADH dehydrogenase
MIIDRRNHHVFQPLLYQVATAVLAPGDVAAPLRQMAVEQDNVSIMLGEVEAVDRPGRSVDVMLPGLGRRRVDYDYLVLAVGVAPSYFGNDQFRKFAPALKSLADAESIRSRILGAYERAEQANCPDAQRAALTFVLIGAGPTGVELAASIAHLARVTLRSNFRRIDPSRTRIVLLEAAPRILGGFAERLATRAQAHLLEMGVEVWTSSPVTAVDQDGVTVRGERIRCKTVLWTAGVEAPPFVRTLGGETDKAGRLRVDGTLTLRGDDRVYAVGDVASVIDRGRPVPGLAQAAIQQGRHAGRSIAARVESQPLPPPFRYVDHGAMAIVGKNFALLQRGEFAISGFMAWCVWALIHVTNLPRLQNRLRVQLQWVWSYFSGQRSDRLITEPPHPQPGASK